MAATGSEVSTDTFSFRQDRLYPLDWSDLSWTVEGTPQAVPVERIVSGTVVGGAPMIGSVNIKDSSTPPNIAFSGIGLDGSYSLTIAPDWQPPFLLWADGYVGGVLMNMLSYVDFGDGEVSKISNITPATTVIVASAARTASEAIDPILLPVPAATAIEEVKSEIQTILENFFAAFDLPASFDLFESPIALGDGSDVMFDAVDFSTDAASDVVITNKADPTIALVITDSTTPEDTTALVASAQSAKSAIEQFQDFFNTLNTLYTRAPADLATLRSQIQPLCAEGLVHTGVYGAADLMELWNFDPTKAPAVGRTLVSCSIYRPMQEQHYGARAIHEMPDGHAQGLWVNVTHNINGRHFSGLTSFVDIGGGNWRFYGNRRPFMSGGHVRPRSHKFISPIGSLVYEHGLHFWNEDVGNNALLNKGLTNIAVFHPAMPQTIIDGLTTNCLRMARKLGGLSTVYGITNVPSQYDGALYAQFGDGSADDLNLNALASQPDKEFVFIGLNAADEPVYAWTRVLNGLPPDMNELIDNDAHYFAAQHAPLDLDDIIIPGTTVIDWELPANDALVPIWSKLEWYNHDWLFNEIYVFNRALYGPEDFMAFSAAEHDASGYAPGIRRAYSVVTMFDPSSKNEYRSAQQHSPWASQAIAAKEGQLFFDVQKSYVSGILSNMLNARVRATDRAASRIETDVVVDSAQTTGNGADLRIEARLLFQPADHWHIGDYKDLFIVSAMIRYRNGELFVDGYAQGLQDASGSVLYTMPAPAGGYPFDMPVATGEAHTLAAHYVAATNEMRIEFDGQAGTFDMSGLAAFDPANFRAAEIRVRVNNINDPDDSGRYQVRCDNVRIDGVAYDDFNSGLGINKWWVQAFE